MSEYRTGDVAGLNPIPPTAVISTLKSLAVLGVCTCLAPSFMYIHEHTKVIMLILVFGVMEENFNVK